MIYLLCISIHWTICFSSISISYDIFFLFLIFYIIKLKKNSAKVKEETNWVEEKNCLGKNGKKLSWKKIAKVKEEKNWVETKIANVKEEKNWVEKKLLR